MKIKIQSGRHCQDEEKASVRQLGMGGDRLELILNPMLWLYRVMMVRSKFEKKHVE